MTTPDLANNLAWLLVAAALIGMAAKRLHVPSSIALVAAGLGVEASGAVAVPHLEPDVVLLIFLPPLLFDTAFRLNAQDLRGLLRPILALAVPGVVITAVVAGAGAALALPISLTAGLLFGSVVGATDPVAVISIFKQLGAPQRIATIAEGESLINDGIAITFYTAVLDFNATGRLDPLSIVKLLGREVGGGVAAGVAFGLLFTQLTREIDDPLIEMTLSTALAYASYLVAHSLGASGPLACVAAGLIHGTYGRRVGMSQQTRARLDVLWEYLGFLANGFVFLLVGFSVNLGNLREHAGPVAVAVAAVLIARTAAVGGLARLWPASRRITSSAERTALVWGGLRGGVTIALALALPAAAPSRPMLIAMAFGVVLFTLIVQGLTLPALLKRLGLTASPS